MTPITPEVAALLRQITTGRFERQAQAADYAALIEIVRKARDAKDGDSR